MSASACQVCGIIAGGATDSRNARRCAECDGRHAVCTACVVRFDLGEPKAKGRLRQCPEKARLMAELMGENTAPRRTRSAVDWERMLEASDDMGREFDALSAAMLAAARAAADFVEATSVSASQATSLIHQVMRIGGDYVAARQREPR